MVDVAVFGARGYLGRGLVSILDDHPDVGSLTPVSTSHAGQAYGTAVPSLGHLNHLEFAGPDARAVHAADVVFLAVGSPAAKQALASLGRDGEQLVVDLSRAHRGQALAGEAPWTYGLTELPTGTAPGDTHVANPGCYPTATLVALGPALTAGLLGQGPLIVDGKSGVSGAGATPRDDLHFPEMNEALRAYAVEGHDHTGEIQAAATVLEQGDPGSPRPVRFTPHLVPQNRGLLVTTYAPLGHHVEQTDVDRVYAKHYASNGLVELAGEPDTSHVRGSTRAQVAVHVDEDAGLLVARCAIDNLVKGGAGTAVQNMNKALGLEEHTGLPLAGVAP